MIVKATKLDRKKRRRHSPADAEVEEKHGFDTLLRDWKMPFEAIQGIYPQVIPRSIIGEALEFYHDQSRGETSGVAHHEVEPALFNRLISKGNKGVHSKSRGRLKARDTVTSIH